jgi:transketolase
MRAIPNMTVLVPGDAEELKQAVRVALDHIGPVYIRIGSGDAEDVYHPNDRFSIGKAIELRSGNDATLITTGTMCQHGVAASEVLENEYGLNVRVLHMASIKPIDEDAVRKAANETGFIVSIEEHNIIGGLGSAVAEIIAELGNAQLKRLGINDRFSGVGTAECLMREENLTVENIINIVRQKKDSNDAMPLRMRGKCQ